VRTTLALACGVVLVAAAAAPTGPQAEAATTASGTAQVRVTVRPAVTVSASPPIVEGGAGSEPFSATIRFHVDANARAVEVSVGATPLRKAQPGDGPSIPVDTRRGVTIGPAEASASAELPRIALFVGEEAVGDVPGHVTERVTLAADANRRLGRDVAVTVAWNRGDAAPPAGVYRGQVRLTALVLP